MSVAPQSPVINWPKSLLLAGAGKMGGAMLRGWLNLGMPASAITVVDPYADSALQKLASQKGFVLNPDAADIEVAEVLVLAIKPQMLDDAAAGLTSLVGPDTMVLSILAGKTIADIASRLPAQAIVRSMPNTPAAVGRGITGAAPSAGVSASQRSHADALLSAIGGVAWLESEEWIDAVTAVSGSGPAYVFYLVECLAKAGAAAGLPEHLAMQLARQTVIGSGELMHQDSDTEASQLRVNVTSPGGTTAAALDVLMAADGLEPLMQRVVAAAKRRAGELSG